MSSIVIVGGLCVRLFMVESFWRVVVTTCVCLAVFLPGCWALVLSATEKNFITSKISAIVMRRGVR